MLSGWGHLSLHAELTLSLGQTVSVKVTLTDDDAGKELGTATFPLTACMSCLLASAAIGVVASQGDWTAYFDNVLVSDISAIVTED
jgi:hypothetical protein